MKVFYWENTCYKKLLQQKYLSNHSQAVNENDKPTLQSEIYGLNKGHRFDKQDDAVIYQKH